MVKVGDKIRILEDNVFGTNARRGEVFSIQEVYGDYVVVSGSRPFSFYPEHYELISTHSATYSIPADTETVTLKYADGSTQDIDVKDRARGVPEWVKDGAWVVHKESGKAYKLIKGERTWCLKDGKESAFETYVWDIDIVHHYRPFTNSDWKWGMWAEYRGEKVFVNGRIDNGVTASKPTNGYFFIPFDELTPTTAP